MRVLLTGAAGTIGRALAGGLPALGHELRGLDLTGAGELAPAFPLGWVTGDCLDARVVDDAVRGVDAVVHLAGNPGEDGLAESLASHVHTTGRLLDAMVRHDVSRIAYASSNHAVGRTARTDLVTTTTRPRPDTFYGVAKVAAEALLSLYADRHRIDAVAMRIGSFGEAPTSDRQLSTWLSPADCVRMVHAAITAPSPGFAVLYGISANERAWWDLAPGRALGYEPADDAERWATAIESSCDDGADGAHVGGPFATPAYDRPAFDG